VLLRQPNGTAAAALSLFDGATAETLRANWTRSAAWELHGREGLLPRSPKAEGRRPKEGRSPKAEIRKRVDDGWLRL